MTKGGNAELVSNLDFDVVLTIQLEGAARLGFDLSHIVLPIYSYRMQLFARGWGVFYCIRLPLP